MATPASATPATFTAAGGAKAATIEGTLIDTKRYAADHKNIGNDHGTMKGCGTACAHEGIPVGLLVGGEKDGEVLILLAPSKSFANCIGQSARVTGSKALGPDTLLPDRVQVKDQDGTHKEVDISGTMWIPGRKNEAPSILGSIPEDWEPLRE